MAPPAIYDVEGFISRDIVERCVGTHIELPPYPSVHYRCSVDPASGVPHGDSFAMVICHKQEGQIIVDVVREIRPPFSPEVVVDQLATLCKRYRISRITGDNYAGEYPKELFRKRGYVRACEEAQVRHLSRLLAGAQFRRRHTSAA